MWFRRFLAPDVAQVELIGPGEAHVHRIEKTLYIGRSSYQEIQIIETAHCGRALVLDGRIQSSEFDEFIYHEPLVHPAMLIHPNPQQVLCIGGGPGAVVREVLRHSTVEKVVLVDIDSDVVQLSKHHLPHMHCGAFDDYRASIIVGDGRKYLEQNLDIFNVIILDLSEPLPGSPAAYLYTREFYQQISNHLDSSGVLALQAGSASIVHMKLLPMTIRTLREVFPFVYPYWEQVPSFGASWSYVAACKGEQDPTSWSIADVDVLIKNRNLNGLRYYEGAAHRRMFTMPKFIASRIEEDWPVITDKNAFFAFEE